MRIKVVESYHIFRKPQAVTVSLPLRQGYLKKYLQTTKNFHNALFPKVGKYLHYQLRKMYLFRYWHDIKKRARYLYRRDSEKIFLYNRRVHNYLGGYPPDRFNTVRIRRITRRRRTIRPGPQAVLHKKTFFRPINNKGYKGFNKRIFPFLIRAQESTLLSLKLIEMSRLVFWRVLRKPQWKIDFSKYKIGLFPYISITKKPLQTRMGKGKGKPLCFKAPVRIGEIFFELNQTLLINTVKKLHRKVAFKLPILTKFILKTRNATLSNLRKKYIRSATCPSV